MPLLPVILVLELLHRGRWPGTQERPALKVRVLAVSILVAALASSPDRDRVLAVKNKLPCLSCAGPRLLQCYVLNWDQGPAL